MFTRPKAWFTLVPMSNSIAFSRSILWFRRDLRIHDHRTFFQATQQSREVVGVFLFDTTILEKLKNPQDRRLTFIFDSVLELREKFRQNGSDLIIEKGNPVEVMPRLAQTLKAEAIFVTQDYEPSAKTRDQEVEKRIAPLGCKFVGVKDQVIFAEREVLNKSGGVFRVFTPYKNAWLRQAAEDSEALARYNPDVKKLAPGENIKAFVRDWSLKEIGFERVSLWLESGESSAIKRLRKFSEVVQSYKTARDFPAEGGTSGLSVHLRFGTVSIRSCARMATKLSSEGANTWLSELVWRDFYHMILDQFPHVTHTSFNPAYQELKWPGTIEHFEMWCSGATGFPIVDAAMRHFNQTGWMHNRLRMIVAMFLTKDLLCDYKWGENYFAKHLLDFDLASNNGGWQWSASTGCDAQPYFRIFNPISQSEKFDPEGQFIKQHLPELRGLDRKTIHAPFDHGVAPAGYCKPIVNHSEQRLKALALFKGV